MTPFVRVDVLGEASAFAVGHEAPVRITTEALDTLSLSDMERLTAALRFIADGLERHQETSK